MSMDRDSARKLLEDSHEFPGPFTFRLVVRPTDAGMVLSTLRAAGDGRMEVSNVTERPSRTGKYVSLQVHCEVQGADVIMDVWEVVHKMDEVLSSM